jgi:hypothetical protein
MAQKSLSELVSRPTALEQYDKPSVRIEEEPAFGYDVTQESGRMEVFAYHHLVKVDLFPRSEANGADKVVITMWGHRGEIVGFCLAPLVRAMARGRGLSIEVRAEKYAIIAPPNMAYVTAARFVERKENEEGTVEPEPDIPGARDVDPAAFNAERKGGKKALPPGA